MPRDIGQHGLRQPHRPQRPPGRLLPVHGREVGPYQQPVRAEHVDEVADGAPVEDQRVVVEPACQFGRPGRGGPRSGLRPALAGRFLVPGPAPEPLRPGQHQREPAGPVAERQSQPGVLLRDPAGEDGGGGQAALHADAERGGRRAGQPVKRRRHRVHEDRRSQPLGLGEEAEEPAVGQRRPADVGGDLHAGQAGLRDVLQFGGGQVGVLQRHRTEPVDPAGRRCAQAGHVLVDPAGEVPPGTGGQPVVQQRRKRGDDLRVHPAGRAGGQAPLRVEPGLPRGEAQGPGRQDPRPRLPFPLHGRLHPRPVGRVAAGYRLGKRAGDHVGVSIDQHGITLPARWRRAPRLRRVPRRPASRWPARRRPGRRYGYASAPAGTGPPRSAGSPPRKRGSPR